MWEGAFEQHARVCILIKSWLPRGAWNSKKGNKSTQWHKTLPLAKCECKSTIISERAQCQLWPAGKGMENSVPLLPVIFRATLRRALMCLDAQIYGFNGHRTCPPTASSLDNEGAVCWPLFPNVAYSGESSGCTARFIFPQTIFAFNFAI